MKNYIDTVPTDTLAHALLRMPDGPDLEQTVLKLRQFLTEKGVEGHSFLCSSLRHMLFQVFYAEADKHKDGEHGPALSRALSISDQVWALWKDLFEKSASAGTPSVEEHLQVTQLMEFISVAKTDEEFKGYLEDLRKVLLRPEDKSLLVTCKWQIELHLTDLLVEALTEAPALSSECTRDIALYHFLKEPQPIDLELQLISCFQGELFLLTPENIHKLNGKHDGKFLKRELDRLAQELPMLDFLHLLSAMNNVEHPSNTVADGVLNGLCAEYQAMLGPVG